MVEAIQFDLVRAFGGMQGLRDEPGLGSALARARQRASYEPASDLASLAAAYGYGLVRDHPFNDGNKRAAFVMMAVFLELNGSRLEAPETEVVAVMLDVAAGSMAEEQLADWLRSRLATTD